MHVLEMTTIHQSALVVTLAVILTHIIESTLQWAQSGPNHIYVQNAAGNKVKPVNDVLGRLTFSFQFELKKTIQAFCAH